MSYDAFISYSQAADGRLAPAVENGLEQLARIWYRRRALRVFRDDTGLAVTPDLWSSIEGALDESTSLVVLASPAASSSHWVNREIDHWRETKPEGLILLAITDGRWAWDEQANDFAWSVSDAIAPSLKGAFPREPKVLDLRWAKSEVQVDLRHPQFRRCIADLAAPLHGVSRDEIEGEDVRQHRRLRRIVRAVVVGLSVLLVAAIAAGALAVGARNRARVQRDTAISQRLSQSSLDQLAVDPQLALLLAQRAYATRATPEAIGAVGRAVSESSQRKSVFGPGGALTSLAVSADGRLVAAAGLGPNVYLVSPQTARWSALHVPGATPGHEVWAAMSSNGALVADGDQENGNVHVWRTASRRMVRTLHMGAHIAALNFSDDGRRLYAVASDGSLKIWSLTGSATSTFQTHADLVSVAMSPDGKTLLAGSSDGRIFYWIFQGGTPQTGSFDSTQGPVNDIAWSPDGSTYVTAGGNGTVSVRYRASKTVYQHGTARSAVWTAAFDPTGKYVVFGGSDDTVRVWHFGTDDDDIELRGHKGAIFGAAFSDQGGSVISTGEDGTIRVWDPSATQPTHDLKGFRPKAPRALAVSVSPSGAVAASGQDGSVRIWKPDGTFDERLVANPSGRAETVAFADRGRLVVASAGSGLLKVWSVASGRRTLTVKSDLDVTASGDARVIATATPTGVAIWNIATGRRERFFRLPNTKDIALLTVSLDVRRLATADAVGRVRLWDLTAKPTETAHFRAHSAIISGMTWSADSALLATSGRDGAIRIWDSTGRLLSTLRGHQGEVRGIAFSPNGRYLASTGADRATRIWDWRLGVTIMLRLTTVEPFGTTAATDVSFFADGKGFATSSEDGHIRTYRCEVCVSTPALLALARARTTRALTADEVATYHP